MYNILVCDDDHDIVAALKIYLGGQKDTRSLLPTRGKSFKNLTGRKHPSVFDGYYDAGFGWHCGDLQNYGRSAIFPLSY